MNAVIRYIIYGYAYNHGPLRVTLESMIERVTTAYDREGGDRSVATFMAEYLDFSLWEVSQMLETGMELLFD